MNFLRIDNHGPLIVSTDYWGSDLARAGKVFCSVNGSAIRVLLPPALYSTLADMRQARECVLSRGPWPAERKPEGVEIMWDDGSDAPFALHLTPESFDLLPGEPEPGAPSLAVQTEHTHSRPPHKALERICHWRARAEVTVAEVVEGRQTGNAERPRSRARVMHGPGPKSGQKETPKMEFHEEHLADFSARQFTVSALSADLELGPILADGGAADVLLALAKLGHDGPEKVLLGGLGDRFGRSIILTAERRAQDRGRRVTSGYQLWAAAPDDNGA